MSMGLGLVITHISDNEIFGVCVVGGSTAHDPPPATCLPEFSELMGNHHDWEWLMLCCTGDRDMGITQTNRLGLLRHSIKENIIATDYEK